MIEDSIQELEDYVVVEASEGVASLSVSPSSVSAPGVSDNTPSFLQSLDTLLTAFLEVRFVSVCPVYPVGQCWCLYGDLTGRGRCGQTLVVWWGV